MEELIVCVCLPQSSPQGYTCVDEIKEEVLKYLLLCHPLYGIYVICRITETGSSPHMREEQQCCIGSGLRVGTVLLELAKAVACASTCLAPWTVSRHRKLRLASAVNFSNVGNTHMSSENHCRITYIGHLKGLEYLNKDPRKK